MAFILIIDANQAHATRASDVLTAAGHACGCVTTAEQAITLLRWRTPDLVLLDQVIPGADGGALPGTLRRLAGIADLPIILLTTDVAAPIGELGNALLDDIRKPVDPGFLSWKVEHALGAHRKLALSERDEPLVADKGHAQRRLRSLA